MFCTYQFKGSGGGEGIWLWLLSLGWDFWLILPSRGRGYLNLSSLSVGIFERRPERKRLRPTLFFPRHACAKRRLLTLIFACLCFKKSLFIITILRTFNIPAFETVILWNSFFSFWIVMLSAAFAETRTVSQRVCWFCLVFTLIRTTNCIRRRFNGY